jgi:LmbE family N-acetylglucosaminyl deacetylase
MDRLSAKTAAVIVAHPDDETLWAGGTILSHPEWNWFIVCLCRGNDEDRSPRFYNALNILKAEGIMGSMDDGPEQKPIDENEIGHAILNLLPVNHFDLVISHNPTGEYNRHIRHEETGKAVIMLWNSNKISTEELWTFAYTDSNKKHLPVAVENADICQTLAKRIWQQKYRIITETYGFEKRSFEAKTTPRAESFWQFTDMAVAEAWLNSLMNLKI